MEQIQTLHTSLKKHQKNTEKRQTEGHDTDGWTDKRGKMTETSPHFVKYKKTQIDGQRSEEL